MRLLSKNLQIDDAELDLYELGIEVIVSTIFTSAFILLIGGMLNRLAEAFLFLICFITLRNYSGGYHAKTRMGCFVASIASYFSTDGIACLIRKIPENVQYFALAAGYFITLVIFYFVAPLENPNKRLLPEWKKHNRVMAFAILYLWIGCSILNMHIGVTSMAYQIWATLTVISFLLWIARR